MKLIERPQDALAENTDGAKGPGNEVVLVWFTDGTGMIAAPSLTEAHDTPESDGVQVVDYIPANLPE